MGRAPTSHPHGRLLCFLLSGADWAVIIHDEASRKRPENQVYPDSHQTAFRTLSGPFRGHSIIKHQSRPADRKLTMFIMISSPVTIIDRWQLSLHLVLLRRGWSPPVSELDTCQPAWPFNRKNFGTGFSGWVAACCFFRSRSSSATQLCWRAPGRF